MRRKWLLIAVGVSVLCVVGIGPVLAQGPGGNPIFATIEYVDERISELTAYVDQKVAELYVYVDESIAEIGGGGVALPSWDLPGGWEWGPLDPEQPDGQVGLYPVGLGCVFGENASVPVLFSNTHAVGIAHLPDREVYLRGDCSFLNPYGRLVAVDLPESDVDVDVWIEWLGEARQATYTVSPPTIP